MLIFEKNIITGLYRCFDDRMDWIAFSGYGHTKREAKTDFFVNQPVIGDPHARFLRSN